MDSHLCKSKKTFLARYAASCKHQLNEAITSFVTSVQRLQPGQIASACLFITICIALSHSRFHAFFSFNMWIAAIPSLGIFTLYTKHRKARRYFGTIALLLFTASMFVPAVQLGNDFFVGYRICRLTLMVIPGIPSLYLAAAGNGYFLSGALLPGAIFMGASANLLFVISGMSFLFRFRNFGINRPVVHLLAKLSLVASILCAVLTACDQRLDEIFLGFGLWVAAMLALTLGSGVGNSTTDSE